jgi:hypothetical protein
MKNSEAILESEIYYDLIISDFGRQAAMDYLKLVERNERGIIKKILKEENCEFYDEYRRIMFSVVADVNYFKRKKISEQYESQKKISSEILIGVGNSKMTNDFFKRVFLRVIDTLIPILKAGYKNIRIAIICNSLSPLVTRIVTKINSSVEMSKFLVSHGFTDKAIITLFGNANILARDVPHCVLRLLSLSSISLKVLILGVENAVCYYKKVAVKSQLEIITLTKKEYQYIDKAVIASVDNTLKAKKEAKNILEKKIIHKYLKKDPTTIVVEACTDFNFGLGRNSLKCFAEFMALEPYLQILNKVKKNNDGLFT